MLVSRSPSKPTGGTKVYTHKVHVGEIIRIIPVVDEKSFANVDERIKLKSKVQIKIVRKSWLKIPMDTNHSTRQIINNVLKKRFSERS